MLEHRGHAFAPSAIKAEGGKYRDLPGAPVRLPLHPISCAASRRGSKLILDQGHTYKIVAIEDPREVVEIYRHSCQLAKRAGFDGVELLAQG